MSQTNTVQDLIGAEFRIYCEQDWAKNLPPASPRPPYLTSISFDQGFAGIYERWEFEHFEDGWRLRNKGTGFYACAYSGEVDGSSEFDPETCKWFIERVGDGKYKVQVPGQDSVRTVKRRQPDYPKTLFLGPFKGLFNQFFSFENLAGRESD